MLAVPPDESWLSVLTRETSPADRSGVPARVRWDRLLESCNRWPAFLARAEDQHAFDEIRVVNRDGERFYDEGEDFWPKRYAIWGRLVAQQPGQVAWSVIDAKAVGRFMPPVFPGEQADSLQELAGKLGLDPVAFMHTLNAYNAACRVGTFDHTALDDCRTEGLAPAKTHWARPIDTAPFYGYALKPGITFTYLGLKTDETAAVSFAGQPSDNLFVAGEMMAGNVLGKGYTAGVGMSIGTAFGRIAGTQAAQAALRQGTAHASA